MDTFEIESIRSRLTKTALHLDYLADQLSVPEESFDDMTVYQLQNLFSNMLITRHAIKNTVKTLNATIEVIK